jgi:NMD protein affecting ribosome stability and mRNA decay
MTEWPKKLCCKCGKVPVQLPTLLCDECYKETQ